MGWDPEAQQFQSLSAEQAANWTRGSVFHEGEEVVLKGITFIIVDIAPAQMKLKPKRVDRDKELAAAKAELEAKIHELSK